MSPSNQSPKYTHAWVRAALKPLRPLIERVQGLKVGKVIATAGTPACGMHGCIIELSDPRFVLKLTDDGGEAVANKLIRQLQSEGRKEGLRFPFVRGVYMVELPRIPHERVFAIIREAIDPDPGLSNEDRSAVVEMSFDLADEREAGALLPVPSKQPSWRLLNTKTLRPLMQVYQDLYRLELGVIDIHTDNIGSRPTATTFLDKKYPAGLVVHDLGSAYHPRRVKLIRLRGSANRRREVPRRRRSRPCPRQSELARTVEEILGAPSKVRSCEIVGQRKMEKVVRSHGWPSAGGVVGFHTPKDQLYVTHEWSLPHEWVHATGLVDDQLGIWICEGLTEFVAEEAARRGGFDHRPTYPGERRVVKEQLVPATGLEPLTLARMVVRAYRQGRDPATDIAAQIKRNPKHKNVPFARLVKSLGPRSGESYGEFSKLVS
tara:strand:- start:5027 stop:6325 length:1299 start_codon:yes stop_codon:yes gene_type:complete